MCVEGHHTAGIYSNVGWDGEGSSGDLDSEFGMDVHGDTSMRDTLLVWRQRCG